MGLMALPLAIGFGIASIPVNPPPGVPSPAALGLYTAIVAGFLISLLGGSRVQIGGPTGAFIPVVAGIVMAHGLPGLWLATFLAGLLLMVLGFVRAGSFSRFIPVPVVIGFTSGIAIIIALQQLKDLLGLRLDGPLPIEAPQKLHVLLGHLNTWDWKTAAISGGFLISIFLIPARWNPRLIILMSGSLLVFFLGLDARPDRTGLATIGSTFGTAEGGHFINAIPSGMPSLVNWNLSWAMVKEVFPSALMIMFLGAVESVLSALATDKMIRDRHDSDQELIAQGVANCVVPWFGGIPVTGAIARSSTNVQSGGRSPVAGLVHAFVLAVVVLLAAPLVAYVPMAILAVILTHVACKMFEYHHFLELRKVTHGELAMAVVTFVLTVAVDLTWGVGFGLGVGAILLILRMREITVLRQVTPSTDRTMGPESLRNHALPMEVMFFRMEGVFFYAVADDLPLRVEMALARAPATRVIILRMGKLLSLDFHGLLVLDELLAGLRKRGLHLLICDVQPHPATMMNKHGFFEELGLENLCGNLEIALKRSEEILKRENRGLV